MARYRGAWRLGLAALAALAAGTAAAQTDTPRPDPLRGMTSRFLTELGSRLDLSESQKARLAQLKQQFQAEHRDELKQLRQEVRRVQQAAQLARQNRNALGLVQARGRATGLRRTAEKLRAEFERQLLGVLTGVQRDQYRALKNELARPAKKLTR